MQEDKVKVLVLREYKARLQSSTEPTIKRIAYTNVSHRWGGNLIDNDQSWFFRVNDHTGKVEKISRFQGEPSVLLLDALLIILLVLGLIASIIFRPLNIYLLGVWGVVCMTLSLVSPSKLSDILGMTGDVRYVKVRGKKIISFSLSLIVICICLLLRH